MSTDTAPAPPPTCSLPSVLTGVAPPSRASRIGASLAFAERAVLRIRHVPDQLIDVTFFPLVMVALFSNLFGGALAGSPGQYLQFLLPGVLVLVVTSTTSTTGMALTTDIDRGVFDRFRSMPVWQPAALVGALLADVGRYALGSTVIVLLGLGLGFRPRGGAVGVLAGVAIVLVFAWSLSWVWASLGLVARTPESVASIGMMVTFPLTFLSNVFVDPATLPAWLRTFVDVNPVSLLVTSVRDLMHGRPLGDEPWWVLATCAGLVATFAPLTMRLYRRER